MNEELQKIFNLFVSEEKNYIGLCRDYHTFLSTDVECSSLFYYTQLSKLLESLIFFEQKDYITSDIDFLVTKLLEDKIYK